MSVIRFHILLFLAVIFLYACTNNSDKKATPEDSLSSMKDSTGNADSLVYEDCYEDFFRNAPQIDTGKIMLTLRNESQMSLKDFFSKNMMSDKYARCTFRSIDTDTIPELVIYNYTGGAHCCDEIYVFAKDKKGFVFKSKLYGGFACIDPATNIFTYSFNETLGYLFSCYACSFSDSSRGYKTLREIELQYVNGKFVVKPYDAPTEKQLFKNLEILKDHGYEEMNNGMMDNGWRKEFAMNLAVWHYNHGKNWNETKKLFDKYYTFQDAAKLWKEFYNVIKESEKENTI